MAVNLKAVLGFDGKAYEAGMRKASGLAKKTSKNISSGLKGAIVGALSVGYIAAKAKSRHEAKLDHIDAAKRLHGLSDGGGAKQRPDPDRSTRSSPQAAQAAPEFTRAALRTVADLEYQIERRGK